MHLGLYRMYIIYYIGRLVSPAAGRLLECSLVYCFNNFPPHNEIYNKTVNANHRRPLNNVSKSVNDEQSASVVLHQQRHSRTW